MVCLGFKHRAAGWKVQMNPLSYGGTPKRFFSCRLVAHVVVAAVFTYKKLFLKLTQKVALFGQLLFNKIWGIPIRCLGEI